MLPKHTHSVYPFFLVASCMCCSPEPCVACFIQDMYNYQELKDIFTDLESETSTLVDKVWLL